MGKLAVSLRLLQSHLKLFLGGTSNGTNYKLTIEGDYNQKFNFSVIMQSSKREHWQNTHDQVQKQMCHNPPNLAQ
jgi:hypothetical protein